MAEDDLRARALGEMRIGGLNPAHMKMAEDIMRKMPPEYSALIGKESTLLSLVRLSEALTENRKMKKAEMEKVGEFAMTCAGASDVLMQQQAQAAQQKAKNEERKPFGPGAKSALVDRIDEVREERRTGKITPKNQTLELGTFAPFAGNEGELERLTHATEVADRFWEMKSPTGKKEFDPKDARDLYRYLFPNRDEAEGWYSAIAPRLKEMARLDRDPELQEKYGDSRFHAITATSKGKNSGSDVVGYTQFSTMPLDDGSVVVFWQYGGVADKQFMKNQYDRNETFRQEGIGSAFYAFRHGIADADAKKMGYSQGVAGTILEAEFIGQADNEDDMRFTKTRLHIHRQMGAKAMILEMEDGTWVTAHMQPRLSPTSNPILLHMCFRPLKYDESEGKKTTQMDKAQAKALVMSYIDNFNREGFDPKDVEDARKILLDRFARANKVLLVPPENLPNLVEMARMDPLLKKQVENDYGSLDEHEKRIKAALAVEKEPTRILGS